MIEIELDVAGVTLTYGFLNALCSVATPLGGVFCNCSARSVPGAMAEPLVAMLIEPDTGPPAGNATGIGAGVCPAGAGVASASVATACTTYGDCAGIGTGVGDGDAVGDGDECDGGVTPPPPPHPVAATQSVDTMANRSSACLKASSLQTKETTEFYCRRIAFA
jgi:hypothetical protein